MSEISNIDFDLIFIANQYLKTLEETLALGIPERKIFIVFQDLYLEYREKYPDGKVKFALTSILTHKHQIKDVFDEQIAELDGNYFLFASDYFRIGTMQRCAEEILNRNIEGDIAELGVFQGEFAQYINRQFPNRMFHLFDTFEGFIESEVKSDNQENLIDEKVFASSMDFFKRTRLELVMSKMKYPEQIQIHKGYFPDTIPKEEKKFALVSIDPDLYKPALAGLKYFYPRLSEGGYIILHDYHGMAFSNSIHKAVADFEKEIGHVAKVPLGDMGGALIITK